MGENYLKSQAKYSKQRRSKVKSEVLAQPELDFRPLRLHSEYCVDATNMSDVSEGDSLTPIPGKAGQVEILRGHQLIGKASEECSTALYEMLQDEPQMSLVVAEVDDLSESVICKVDEPK